MSQTEKKEVIENRTGFTEGQQRPLAQMLKIITTPTLWFCAMDDFGSSLALNIVTVEGPTFIKEFLGKDISEVMNTHTHFYSALEHINNLCPGMLLVCLLKAKLVKGDEQREL